MTIHIEPDPEQYALLSKEYTNFVVAAETMAMTIESIADGDINITLSLNRMCKGIRRHNTVVPPILRALRGQDDADGDDD